MKEYTLINILNSYLSFCIDISAILQKEINHFDISIVTGNNKRSVAQLEETTKYHISWSVTYWNIIKKKSDHGNKKLKKWFKLTLVCWSTFASCLTSISATCTLSSWAARCRGVRPLWKKKKSYIIITWLSGILLSDWSPAEFYSLIFVCLWPYHISKIRIQQNGFW